LDQIEDQNLEKEAVCSFETLVSFNRTHRVTFRKTSSYYHYVVNISKVRQTTVFAQRFAPCKIHTASITRTLIRYVGCLHTTTDVHNIIE